MKKKLQQAGRPAARIPYLIQVCFSLVLFLALSLLLYRPYLKGLGGSQLLIPVNSALAAGGGFLLSRRWLASFDASAVAGAFYGMGVFVLSFGIYHPLAGLSVALLPWLFCPAALWKAYAPAGLLTILQRGILLVLPFAVIVLFFWLPARPWVGPVSLMPLRQAPHLADLYSLAGLGFTGPSQIVPGLYPTAVILALMGFFVYLKVLRVAVLVPVLGGLVLMFCNPVLGVPPIVWASIPLLFVCILAGLGAQAFSLAGPLDAKWILFCALAAGCLGAFAAVRYFLQAAPGASVHPVKMYAAATLLCLILYLMGRAGNRAHLFRWILIGIAAGADVLLSGRLFLSGLFQ